MGMTADTIAVDIIARMDKLEAGLRKAENIVDRSANRMNKKIGGGIGSGSRFVTGTLRGFGMMATAAAGASLVEPSVHGFNWAAASFSGNALKAKQSLDKLDEALQNLPLGLSAVYDQFKRLSEWAYGNPGSKFDALIAQSSKALGASWRGMDIENDLKNQRSLLGATDDSDRASIQRRIDKATADIERVDNEIAGMTGVQAESIKQLEYEISDMKFSKTMRALQSRASFDTASTVLGTYKAANRTARPDEAAQEDTQKQILTVMQKTSAMWERILRNQPIIQGFE